MKKKTIIKGLVVLVSLGMVSHVVESSIDKEEVKYFVTTNFQEKDEEGGIDFENGDKDETTFLEKIGY